MRIAATMHSTVARGIAASVRDVRMTGDVVVGTRGRGYGRIGEVENEARSGADADVVPVGVVRPFHGRWDVVPGVSGERDGAGPRCLGIRGIARDPNVGSGPRHARIASKHVATRIVFR